MKKVIAGLAVLTLSITGAYAGEVYKWTDAEGKVHFSARPPTEKAATVEVKKYKGAQPAGSGPSEQNVADAKEFAKAMENELTKVDETNKTLNCSSATSNINWQFETIFTQAKRNLDNGIITQDQYNQAMSQLQKAKNEISYSRCQAATGVERSFYVCMSNDKNHLIGCGPKYNF